MREPDAVSLPASFVSAFQPFSLSFSLVTTPQYRLVYAIARKLGYDNDVLHSLVRDWTGKGHLRELREDEAHKLINRLKKLAGQTPDHTYHSPTMNVSTDGTMNEFCSLAQAYMIRYLCRTVGVNLVRLWAVVHTRFGLTQAENTLGDLTYADAEKLILQLKTELADKRVRAEAAERQGALPV